MSQFKLAIFLMAGVLTTTNAGAVVFDFDNDFLLASDPRVDVAIGAGGDRVGPEINYSLDGFSVRVTGGRSNIQLAGAPGLPFTVGTDVILSDVIQDITPSFLLAGLGVNAGLDTVEGSVGGNFSADEILLFDFGEEVFLEQFNLNGFNVDTPAGLWSVFSSADGVAWTATNLVGLLSPENIFVNMVGQYFGVASIGGPGPTTGGHIASLTIEGVVPEPATIILLGLGLGFVGFRGRPTTR